MQKSPFRQSNTVAVANSSPGMGGAYPSAFSFPKLNGSPSTNASLTNGHPGGTRPTTLGCNGFAPGPLGRGAPDNLSGSGSGSGFMGFGPTGFTTPIDTVLDRWEQYAQEDVPSRIHLLVLWGVHIFLLVCLSQTDHFRGIIRSQKVRGTLDYHFLRTTHLRRDISKTFLLEMK